jgi:hypothetical protein
LQAPCQILINGFAWLESPISHFIDYNVHNDSIYLMYHTALLPLSSVAFPILNRITSDSRSKGLIELDEFEHPKFETVEMSIY